MLQLSASSSRLNATEAEEEVMEAANNIHARARSNKSMEGAGPRTLRGAGLIVPREAQAKYLSRERPCHRSRNETEAGKS
jgi:hypothetical protein